MQDTNQKISLNNIEPQMYYAEYPSPEQQNRYAQRAGLAALLVTLLCFTALTVSALS